MTETKTPTDNDDLSYLVGEIIAFISKIEDKARDKGYQEGALRQAEMDAESMSEFKSRLLEEIEGMKKAFPLREDNPQYSLGQTNGWYLALEEVKNRIKTL